MSLSIDSSRRWSGPALGLLLATAAAGCTATNSAYLADADTADGSLADAPPGAEAGVDLAAGVGDGRESDLGGDVLPDLATSGGDALPPDLAGDPGGDMSMCPPCDPNAKCQIVNGQPTCVCGTGYFGDGRICKPIDACAAKPCQNGGACMVTGQGTYACTCAMGYEGANCENAINACKVNPCQNGGLCMITGPGAYKCACAMGYDGTNCQNAINACQPNPCLNGGVCKSTGPGTWLCTCAMGYSGTNCQMALNACLPNPCQNGGSCAVTGPGSYKCACALGFSGTNCEVRVSSCMPMNPCLHGQCKDTAPGKYACTCDPNWSGANCDQPVNACMPNPCLNNGVCKSTGPGMYSCTCAMGFNGNNCQNAIDACMPNPCKNGGMCLMAGPGVYKCACAIGYEGVNCESPIDACKALPCLNNGVCKSTGPGTYTCTCPRGYSGTNCEIIATFCDVVYRLDSAMPKAGAGFRVVKTGQGAMDTVYAVGDNSAAPGGVGSPFSKPAFPRGFLRLRFPAGANAPIAGAVQIVEYYMPLEATSGIPGATVRTDVDHSAGLLALTNAGCPTMVYDACLPAGNNQTLKRACVGIGSGVLMGTTLAWDTCTLTPPVPPAPNAGMTPAWTFDQSQIAAAAVAGNPGCLRDVTSFGNVSCQGLLCGFVPPGTLGVQRNTWDQKLNSFVFSSTDYAKATIQLAETTLPDPQADVYDSIRWSTATPFRVECGAEAMLTCDEQ